MKKILIICWGNIHRSVIAEQMLLNALRELGLAQDYAVTSRGIQGTMKVDPPRHLNLRDYPEQYSIIEGALARYGVHIPPEKKATPVSAHDAHEADIILVLGRAVMGKLQDEWGARSELLEKTRLLADVEDPYQERSAETLRDIVGEIHVAISGFASSLKTE